MTDYLHFTPTMYASLILVSILALLPLRSLCPEHSHLTPQQPPPLVENGDDYNDTVFQNAMALVALFSEQVPPWPKKMVFDESLPDDLSREDWQRYIIIAHTVTRTDPAAVELALMIYSALSGYVQDDPERFDRGKVTVLLRVCFRLPEDQFQWQRDVPFILVCDGFGYVKRDELAADSLALPVDWRDDFPSLSAFGVIPGGGRPSVTPHLTYRYFKRHYDFRRLAPLIDRDSELWQELRAEGIVEDI